MINKRSIKSIKLLLFIIFYSGLAISDEPTWIELPYAPIQYSTSSDELSSLNAGSATETETDFQKYIPADNDWVYCSFRDLEGRRIRQIELKKPTPKFNNEFNTFKQKCGAHELSWSGVTTYLSTSTFIQSKHDLRESVITCQLLGNDGYKMPKETIKPIINGFLEQLTGTQLYKTSKDRIETLANKYLPTEDQPESLVEVFVGGPVSGLSFGRLHTDGNDRGTLLAQAFLATEAPTVVFPLVVSDSEIKCPLCSDQYCTKCTYHTLLKQNHGFCAPASTLLIASGAIAHAGPESSRETRHENRMLMGAKINISKALIDALNKAGKKEAFFKEYWGEYL